MDRCSVVLIHLIELVNKTDTFIGQHQSSSLEFPFVGRMVSFDTGSQTDC